MDMDTHINKRIHTLNQTFTHMQTDTHTYTHTHTHWHSKTSPSYFFMINNVKILDRHDNNNSNNNTTRSMCGLRHVTALNVS